MFWVDDIIPIAATLNELSYMKDLIASQYEIRDMGNSKIISVFPLLEIILLAA